MVNHRNEFCSGKVANGDIATPTQELTKQLGAETATLKDIFAGLNTSLQKIMVNHRNEFCSGKVGAEGMNDH
jgi:hypothetical protein